MIKLGHSKSLLNMVFAAISLVVVASSALVMTKNVPTVFKSSASNLNETRNGTLVKKGSNEFLSKCTATRPAVALQKESSKKNAPTPKPIAPGYSFGIIDGAHCTPLIVDASLANSLVGKKVTVKGTEQRGIFYATSIKAFVVTP